METVYLETTIISYLVSEPSRDLIVAAHQQITREWWTHRRSLFSCSVSQVVVNEVSQGAAEHVARRVAVVKDLPKLPALVEAETLTLRLLQSGALPAVAAADAAHVAIATTAGMDYLLTWNCRHLANGQILKKIAEVCSGAGYRLPEVCTPEELMGENANV
ncbi:MAG: type II toxin-antitoxin system VapC family toxin [Verrucomicrobiota bacterium]